MVAIGLLILPIVYSATEDEPLRPDTEIDQDLGGIDEISIKIKDTETLVLVKGMNKEAQDRMRDEEIPVQNGSIYPKVNNIDIRVHDEDILILNEGIDEGAQAGMGEEDTLVLAKYTERETNHDEEITEGTDLVPNDQDIETRAERCTNNIEKIVQATESVKNLV